MSFRSHSPRPSPPPERGERIAKLLARAGVASRREVERMIEEGRVAVAGVAISTPATLLTSLDGVTVDGEPVAAVEAARLFLYHKPVGLLVTERDPGGRTTIYDRLPSDLPRVMPVGRLDLNTEGLLLLTTDGGLKRQLELPVTGVERTYRARAYGQVSQAQLEDLIEGIEIEGIRYGKIDANLERRTGANVWIEMTLAEGKNREVRRVLEHLGLKVGRLIRTRYGPFVLGDLPPGAVGEIRQHDVESFRAHPTRVDLPQPARRRDAGHDPEVRLVRPRSSPLPVRVPGGQRPALSRSGRGPDRPDTGSGVGRPVARGSRSPATNPPPAPPFQGGEQKGATLGRVSNRPHSSAHPAPSSGARGRGRERVEGTPREERDRPPARDQRPAKGPSLGRGKPRREAPAATKASDLANPARAKRAAAHRQATGRDETAATPRPPRPVRGKGWAKAKPPARPKPGGPRKPGPRN